MKVTEKLANFPYYFGIVVLFLLLKYLYTLSSNDDVLFLLFPTNICIELITGSKTLYSTDGGFAHTTLPINIDKSCSGFNFWLLSFSLLSLSTLHLYKRHWHKLAACVALLIISFIVTVFINVSRILIAILTLKYKGIYTFLSQGWMHEAQGAFIYLLFLILLYRSTYYITVKLTKTNAYTH
jgi:exosortase K